MDHQKAGAYRVFGLGFRLFLAGDQLLDVGRAALGHGADQKAAGRAGSPRAVDRVRRRLQKVVQPRETQLAVGHRTARDLLVLICHQNHSTSGSCILLLSVVPLACWMSLLSERAHEWRPLLSTRQRCQTIQCPPFLSAFTLEESVPQKEPTA